METFWKNKLQEYCQSHNLRFPIYTYTDRGPDNPSIRFDARCKVESWVTDSDSPSPTKKLADQKAAKLMLKVIANSQSSYDDKSEVRMSVTKLPPILSEPRKPPQDLLLEQRKPIIPGPAKYGTIPIKNADDKPRKQNQKAKAALISSMNRDGFPEPQFIFECVVYLPNGTYYRSGEHVNPREAEEEVAKMALDHYL